MFLSGLGLGLFIAVIVYFHEHSATIENNNLLTASESVVDDKNNVDIAPLPELQFEFHKILPNKKVNISEWESVAADDIGEQREDKPVMFVLQVGSFKELAAADEVKAKLAMMGVTADIQRVVINGQDVRHRVRIGPYEDTEKLQQVRARLLANDLSFMLLKLKMEDI